MGRRGGAPRRRPTPTSWRRRGDGGGGCWGRDPLSGYLDSGERREGALGVIPSAVWAPEILFANVDRSHGVLKTEQGERYRKRDLFYLQRVL